MSDGNKRFRIECTESVVREWLLAEAFEAGALGAEEREFDGRFLADIYGAPEALAGIRSALAELDAPGAWIGRAEALPEVDWSEAWKEGLTALEISPRLVIRPPFLPAESVPGQRQIVIDPGQAFGTGNHASTRLCLEWLDALLLEAEDSADADRAAWRECVLDVGTGSGVLSLAAVALGAKRAIGFDLDPVAIEAAQHAARENELADRVEFFEGPIDDVPESAARVGLVLANLLKREMLPIATQIAGHLAPGGRLVLSGLLEEDLAEVLERFEREGLRLVGSRASEDAIGNWVGPCLARE